MKKVVYDGMADYQVFSKADFSKADVEQNQLKFKKGEVTEVEDSVADALLSSDGVFGGFNFREPKDGDEGHEVEATDTGATPQQDVDEPRPTRARTR